LLDDISAQLVSSATALLNWHDNARFSAVDGSPTKPVRHGWARLNPLTGQEEFPRIDPAVICLVHDGGDRAVLARQTIWPQRMFSLLAGFVEAGESFELCRTRRRRLDQRLGFQAAASGVRLDRPADHRILGGGGLNEVEVNRPDRPALL
jgi:NAD+ diphosphatase